MTHAPAPRVRLTPAAATRFPDLRNAIGVVAQGDGDRVQVLWSNAPGATWLRAEEVEAVVEQDGRSAA